MKKLKKIAIIDYGMGNLFSIKSACKKVGLNGYLSDDKKNDNRNKEIKKNIISYKKLLTKNIDYIIISPGIDIQNCNLSNFLKTNIKKIYTDLDVFFSHYKRNKKITITGTNCHKRSKCK